ncbi:MAG: MerR family transcriptional regulator [Candidatus Manganitrophus sp.]|nr:MerR family transcriptional regulator [Candidatus Manganitrophus sp.]MDC4223502.1 MerR family transcriptional regulator [Candidatus Manganitrophus sp.]WDT70624.1 MAG: MerR family transcriptional regulator [Candidatus Manganitrophus sp.]
MKTSEILHEVDIPRHKLYYLEQKGYVIPKRIPMGDLEAREYSREDLLKIKLIWKYLAKGFKHKVAYEMALEELNVGVGCRLPGIEEGRN